MLVAHPNEQEGEQKRDFQDGPDAACQPEYESLQKEIAQKGSVREFKAKLRKKDGTEMDCLITTTVRQARDKSKLGYQGIVRDISELVSSRKQIENTLNDLRKALGGTIEAMALTVETRDPYTAGHQRRVSNLARGIATELGVSKAQIQGVRMAGVIHDIGKISVPGEILSKPGNISQNELGIIKEHPQVGYNILKNVDFPDPDGPMIERNSPSKMSAVTPSKARTVSSPIL